MRPGRGEIRGRIAPGTGGSAWPRTQPGARERAAIEAAVTAMVGAPETRRLVELGERLRAVEARPERPANALERALALMETAEGRAILATKTWETV